MNALTTTAGFDKAINVKKPVLVKFEAEWCPPCKAIAPVVKEIAEAFADEIDVYSFDIDKDKGGKLTESLNIQAVPSLVMFKDGVETDRIIGNTPKAEIRAMVRRALGKTKKK